MRYFYPLDLLVHLLNREMGIQFLDEKFCSVRPIYVLNQIVNKRYHTHLWHDMICLIRHKIMYTQRANHNLHFKILYDAYLIYFFVCFHVFVMILIWYRVQRSEQEFWQIKFVQHKYIQNILDYQLLKNYIKLFTQPLHYLYQPSSFLHL